MGRHVAAEIPELDRVVDDACAAIGREIEAQAVPGLAGVVLGGGYGRGEGGARGDRRLSNDLDFFAITEDGAAEGNDVPRIAAALEPISRKWTEKLGVDVDFTVRTPWRIRHDQERIMVQELVRGYFDVAGAKGEVLFAGIERREPSELPWMEAARLLMNRGMGLLFAMVENGESWSPKLELEKGKVPLSNSNSELELIRKRDFVNRNINKCVLGAGDARLVARHAYAWRAEERAKALGDALYSAAVEWKFRPRAEPVCDWEKAREVWLSSFGEVCDGSMGAKTARNLRNAVRWIVRRRSIGDLRTFALDPVVRVLDAVALHVRERRSIDDALMRDWKIFN